MVGESIIPIIFPIHAHFHHAKKQGNVYTEKKNHKGSSHHMPMIFPVFLHAHSHIKKVVVPPKKTSLLGWPMTLMALHWSKAKLESSQLKLQAWLAEFVAT
jgi:hypothetical protein